MRNVVEGCLIALLAIGLVLQLYVWASDGRWMPIVMVVVFYALIEAIGLHATTWREPWLRLLEFHMRWTYWRKRQSK